MNQDCQTVFTDFDQSGEPDFFQKKSDALGYILKQGLKISKSKFYQDIQAGELLLDDQGRISLDELSGYIQRLDQAGRTWGYRRLEREKLELEIKVLKLREKLLKFQCMTISSQMKEELEDD